MPSVCPSVCQPSLKAENGPLQVGVSTRGSAVVTLTHSKLALYLTNSNSPVRPILVPVLPLGPSRSLKAFSNGEQTEVRSYVSCEST